MAAPTNPNQSGPSIEGSLETGLAALKKKDYPSAIAHLEFIAETQSEQSSGHRAKMGLVIAYEKTGQVKKAIALCSTLTKHSNEQVKTWASNTLKNLIKRHPPKLATQTVEKISPNPPQKPADMTGFVPFNQQPTPPENNTGFVPFDPTIVPKTTQQKPLAPPPPPTRLSPTVKAETPLPNVEVPVSSTILNPQPPIENSDTTPPSYEFTWRQAGRAQKWRQLKALNFSRFWFEQGVSAIALFWLTLNIVRFLELTTNDLLVQLPYLEPIQILYRDPTFFIYSIFLLLVIVSPWLMDALLKVFYGLEPLPMTTLFNSSQEASRVLRNFANNTGKPMPTLKILPVQAPFAISYGCLPRFARITISQGLLEQLTEDEIAAIYARELGHIAHWDFVLMSLATLVIQIPYLIYWQVAYWGERSQALENPRRPAYIPGFVIPILPFVVTFFRAVTAIISALSYGIFWLLRWPMLWVSRRRVFLSDRFAAETTGNPNGLTRALVKIAIGIAADIQQQKQTSTLLEGFELLTPLGCNQAAVLGAVAFQTPLESILQWDISNPYRHWLVINQAHPLCGERLQLLGFYAQFWKLETELDLAKPELGKQKSKFSFSLPQRLLLQGAPFFGIPMSLTLVGGIWVLGGIFSVFNIWQLNWLWGDRSILLGCLPIGFSLGTFIRINDFFPDIKAFAIKESTLPEILSNPETLPVDSQPIRLQGQLLGRTGISNWLGQDLILQTATGLVKLHHISLLGPLGNLWPADPRPSDLVGKTVVATGWLRRGAIPSIDLESLKTQGGSSYSNHPIWSTIAACLATCWGVYIIVRGGF